MTAPGTNPSNRHLAMVRKRRAKAGSGLEAYIRSVAHVEYSPARGRDLEELMGLRPGAMRYIDPVKPPDFDCFSREFVLRMYRNIFGFRRFFMSAWRDLKFRKRKE
jgi:hypothetical protein